METPVILSACRTPIGKFRGALSKVAATDLGAAAIREAVRRASLPLESIDEVIMGNVLSAGLGQAPARQAALHAGLNPTTSCVTVNMVCGSGMKAMMLAAQAIRCGDADVVVAGGMESMSQTPLLLARDQRPLGDRTLVDSMLHDGLTCSLSGTVPSGESMGRIAEQLAEAMDIGRREQDEFAVESHRRAIAAIDSDTFANELAPVPVEHAGADLAPTIDEGPRRDTTQEGLERLPTVFRKDGTVTAGNASMISDGAAAIVVASERFAKAQGMQPLARIIGASTAGTAPNDLFVAPVLAIQKLLKRQSVSIDDIDTFEINEAFAVQMIACLRQLDLSHGRVNLQGGAIALGHPIGASGARIVATLVHALKRHRMQHGVAAACLGGGDAVAMMVQRD